MPNVGFSTREAVLVSARAAPLVSGTRSQLTKQGTDDVARKRLVARHRQIARPEEPLVQRCRT